ncbi:RNA-directed DNA polymerase, eukaryota, nucleotide-binding alpha-beta plait domain protein [Tanacetum coccineum]
MIIINYPNLVIQDQTPRARRAYRDREREQVMIAAYVGPTKTRDATVDNVFHFARNVQELSGGWLPVGLDNTQEEVESQPSFWKLLRHMTYGYGIKGSSTEVSMYVNVKSKNMAYYLTDGIYPSWDAFVKSISSPQIRKHRLFAQHQEAVRKDVERAFGVLQARFAFLRHPCHIWGLKLNGTKQMGQIMIACVIMHNMIVEDERETYQNYDPSIFFNDTQTNGDDDVVAFSTE